MKPDHTLPDYRYDSDDEITAIELEPPPQVWPESLIVAALLVMSGLITGAALSVLLLMR